MCISVLIPFYNTKFEYFKECLESIENQTFKLFIEIIIINDGSSKESMIQVNKYLDMLNSRYKKYKIFNLNKNYGIQYALNIGLVKCSYNFVARMDADDIMKPDRIQKQYDFMRKHENCIVLGGQCEFMNEDTKEITYVTKHKNIINKQFLKKTYTHWFINHPTVMYKRDIILKNGGYNLKLLGHAEDVELWLRLIKNGYIIHNLSDIILTYRDCPNSLSHNFKYNVIRDIKKWISEL